MRREKRGLMFFFVPFVSSWQKIFAELKKKKGNGCEDAKSRKGFIDLLIINHQNINL